MLLEKASQQLLLRIAWIEIYGASQYFMDRQVSKNLPIKSMKWVGRFPVNGWVGYNLAIFESQY